VSEGGRFYVGPIQFRDSTLKFNWGFNKMSGRGDNLTLNNSNVN
jgi:hypothetical protein